MTIMMSVFQVPQPQGTCPGVRLTYFVSLLQGTKKGFNLENFKSTVFVVTCMLFHHKDSEIGQNSFVSVPYFELKLELQASFSLDLLLE